jgi:hypothetical protein
LRGRIFATLCLLSAVLASQAAARTPAQLHVDVANAVRAFAQADVFSSTNRAAARKRDAALQPLKGKAPAQLGSAKGAYAFRWLTVTRHRCYALAVPGSGYSSPFGPCLPATTPCAVLCLDSLGARRPVTGGFVFYAGGTVPRTATTVEITLLDGRRVTAKPSAGLVDGLHGVVVPLGRSDLRSAVARAGNRVVGRMTRTAASIRHECALLRLHCTP